MSTILPARPIRRALIVIPGTVNYFYNQSGRRVADALRSLGFWTEVRTLTEYETQPQAEFDLCVFSNIKEVLHSYGNDEKAIRLIGQLREQARETVSLALDCVGTHWFRVLCDTGRHCGVTRVLDLGLCEQQAHVPADLGIQYRFVFNGLTPFEQPLAFARPDDTDRRFPWAFVGHNTPSRAALVDQLVQRVHPGGFVYIPSLAPYTEKNSPHLNQQQFEFVLSRTRYQIWCSHHDHFYMEPERFRTSLLTGSVPVKIVEPWTKFPNAAPFHYLMMSAADLPERLTPEVFDRVRRQFISDWQRMPTLSDGLHGVLSELGLLPELSTRPVTRVS